MMKGNRVNHWIIVDGVDNVGNIRSRDPWMGTRYSMRLDVFESFWLEFAVYKQR